MEEGRRERRWGKVGDGERKRKVGEVARGNGGRWDRERKEMGNVEEGDKKEMG